ncbi:MAG: TIGR00730 family Rossman fold protein [Ilumatobacteraceae bacterium]|nr:TIGR00730 family Rossman fold protein [Ilumatobacteraceae bacterium]
MDLGRNRRLGQQLIESAFALLSDRPNQLDLKIAGAALEEMREAFKMFAPFRDVPKVTIFGSARTQMADPLYMQARDVAAKLAEAGWMVVTGAGPGIMQAAMEGAGRDKSIGVSIRLPFEQGANPVIAGDVKYVSMKYFFTRKLMLIKESRGFVCLPGGFGTLDETFELLTLTQTGKGLPVPIVFLDTPGDPYWETVHDFVGRQLVERGLVAAADTELYLVTDETEAAVNEVLGFYRNFDSIRYVGHLVVMRMKQAPTDAQLAMLNEKFGSLCKGGIARATPFEPERRENDKLDLARITFTLANHSSGVLREILDTINSFVDR